MTIDRYTKVILTLIAIGLWANFAAPVFYSTMAGAQSYVNVREIENNVRMIAMGVCTNRKICGQ